MAEADIRRPCLSFRWSDSAVEVLEKGRNEEQVSLDSGSDPIGHHQGLELTEAEFSPLIFLADDVAEEDSLLRVIFTGVPGPLGIGIEKLDQQDLLVDSCLLGSVEGGKGPTVMT